MIYFCKKLLSYLYSFFLSVVWFLYNNKILKKHIISDVCVVSVGNISVGGSGKTPMVSFLANVFDSMPFSYSIISRGYKRSSKKNLVVSNGGALLVDVEKGGDEPFLLALKHPNVPVVVGDKIKGCYVAKERFLSDVVILDDGFQSHYIKKNVNILLVDSSVSFKNYSLLPLGKLREPFSALKRADVVILTKTNLPNRDRKKIKDVVLANLSSQLYLESEFVPTLLKYNYVSDKFDKYDVGVAALPVVAFCGIENSKSFDFMVKNLSFSIKEFFVFPDHHNYSTFDIKKILDFLNKNNMKTIITTFKDFVKLKKYFVDYYVFIVDVEHVIVNKLAFVNFLSKKLLKN